MLYRKRVEVVPAEHAGEALKRPHTYIERRAKEQAEIRPYRAALLAALLWAGGTYLDYKNVERAVAHRPQTTLSCAAADSLHDNIYRRHCVPLEQRVRD